MAGAPNSGRLARLIGLLLLFGAPAITLLWLTERVVEEATSSTRSRGTALLERKVQDLFFQADARRAFCRGFRQSFAWLATHGGPGGPGIASLPRFLPEAFRAQLVVFPPAGAGRYPPWCRPFAAPLVRSFWDDLRNARNEQVIGATRMQRYRSLFGMGFLIDDLLGLEDAPYPIGPGKTDGLLVWKRFPDGGGMVAFARDLPDPWTMVTGHLRTAGPGPSWAAASAAGEEVTTSEGWTPENQAWFREGILQGGGAFSRPGAVLRLVRHPEGFWVGGCLPLPAESPVFFHLRLWSLAIMLVLLWIAVRSGLQTDPFSSWGITHRTLAFFFLGSILPVVLLISAGIRAFFQGEILREEQVHASNLSRIREMEVALLQEKERELAFFRRLKENPVVLGNDPGAFASLTSRLERQRLLFGIHTRDEFGKPILVSEAEMQVMDDLLAVPLQRLIRSFLKKPEIPPGNEMERQILQVFSSSGFGLGPMFSKPDQTMLYSIGMRQFTLYFDLLRPAPDRPAAFIHAKQFQDWTLARFFRRWLPPDILVYRDRQMAWFPREPGYPGVEGLLAQVLQGRRAVHDLVGEGPEARLVSACPSTQLEGVCFLAVTPFGEQAEAASRERLLLIGGTLLIFVLGFLCARMVSRALLQPIRAIAGGVEALVDRRWRHRLSDQGDDEFGEIRKAMNHLSMGMLEIDRAMEVQANMLPRSIPDLAEYDMAVHFQPTSDLGGDYVDVVARPDGLLALVIGDVTGHGIGSALLTASAKVLFYDACRDQRSPPVFLDALNQFIRETLEGRKFMTIATALLEPATHTFRWWSGGHPYLLFRSPGNPPEFLGKPCAQAGIRAKVSWPSFERVLVPGEVVVFYSDGVSEALDAESQVFGYERLQAALGAARGGTAQEILGEILAAVEAFSGGIPPGDDLTLLVLRRRESGGVRSCQRSSP